MSLFFTLFAYVHIQPIRTHLTIKQIWKLTFWSLSDKEEEGKFRPWLLAGEAGLRPSVGGRLILPSPRLPLLQPLRLKQDYREGLLLPPQPPRVNSLVADGNLLLQSLQPDRLLLLFLVCDLHSHFFGCTPKPAGSMELGCHPLGWHPVTAEGHTSFTFLFKFLLPHLNCHSCTANEVPLVFLVLSAHLVLGGRKTSS